MGQIWQSEREITSRILAYVEILRSDFVMIYNIKTLLLDIRARKCSDPQHQASGLQTYKNE